MVPYLSTKFKSKREREEFSQISSNLRLILDDMSRWVDAHGYSFVITDLLSDAYEDTRLKRVSKSHSEGRAADVSIQGWTKEFCAKFENFFEQQYGSKYGAFSKRTGKINLVELHDNGNGPHAHIQVRA